LLLRTDLDGSDILVFGIDLPGEDGGALLVYLERRRWGGAVGYMKDLIHNLHLVNGLQLEYILEFLVTGGKTYCVGGT
jgi:ABC-type phosphate transport system auxiliary subunit